MIRTLLVTLMAALAMAALGRPDSTPVAVRSAHSADCEPRTSAPERK